MITYAPKQQAVIVPVAVQCNFCGADIPEDRNFPEHFQYATFSAHWGFGSKHDMEKFEMHACEKCTYETILNICMVQPEIQEVL